MYFHLMMVNMARIRVGALYTTAQTIMAILKSGEGPGLGHFVSLRSDYQNKMKQFRNPPIGAKQPPKNIMILFEAEADLRMRMSNKL